MEHSVTTLTDVATATNEAIGEARSKFAILRAFVGFLFSTRGNLATFRVEQSMHGRPSFIVEQLSITVTAPNDEHYPPTKIVTDGNVYVRVGEADGRNSYVWAGSVEAYTRAQQAKRRAQYDNDPPDELA